MCPTIKKGHSCKAAHADVITAREPIIQNVLEDLAFKEIEAPAGELLGRVLPNKDPPT
jgi:hypothetical protein